MGSIALTAVNNTSDTITGVLVTHVISGRAPVSSYAASLAPGARSPSVNFDYVSGSNDYYLLQFSSSSEVNQGDCYCNVGTSTTYVTIQLYDDYYNVTMDGTGNCENKSYGTTEP